MSPADLAALGSMRAENVEALRRRDADKSNTSRAMQRIIDEKLAKILAGYVDLTLHAHEICPIDAAPDYDVKVKLIAKDRLEYSFGVWSK